MVVGLAVSKIVFSPSAVGSPSFSLFSSSAAVAVFPYQATLVPSSVMLDVIWSFGFFTGMIGGDRVGIHFCYFSSFLFWWLSFVLSVTFILCFVCLLFPSYWSWGVLVWNRGLSFSFSLCFSFILFTGRAGICGL